MQFIWIGVLVYLVGLHSGTYLAVVGMKCVYKYAHGTSQILKVQAKKEDFRNLNNIHD